MTSGLDDAAGNRNVAASEQHRTTPKRVEVETGVRKRTTAVAGAPTVRQPSHQSGRSSSAARGAIATISDARDSTCVSTFAAFCCGFVVIARAEVATTRASKLINAVAFV